MDMQHAACDASFELCMWRAAVVRKGVQSKCEACMCCERCMHVVCRLLCLGVMNQLMGVGMGRMQQIWAFGGEGWDWRRWVGCGVRML